jgi:hypothetical protein
MRIKWNGPEYNEIQEVKFKDVQWTLRDARSSPFVRLVDGKEQRYNWSPELDKYEAQHGVYRYPARKVVSYQRDPDDRSQMCATHRLVTEKWLKTGQW